MRRTTPAARSSRPSLNVECSLRIRSGDAHSCSTRPPRARGDGDERKAVHWSRNERRADVRAVDDERISDSHARLRATSRSCGQRERGGSVSSGGGGHGEREQAGRTSLASVIVSVHDGMLLDASSTRARGLNKLPPVRRPPRASAEGGVRAGGVSARLGRSRLQPRVRATHR